MMKKQGNSHQTPKTKWITQSLTKYNYYINTLFPTLFTKSDDSSKINLKCMSTSNGISYFWGAMGAEEVTNITPEIFHSTFLRSYLNDNVVKIGSSFLKTTQYSSSYFYRNEATELLQLFIEQIPHQKPTKHKHHHPKHIEFNAYILHYPDNNNYLKWNHFIEKYSFAANTLNYDIICSINDSGYFKTYTSNARMLIQHYSQNLNKFIGLLLQLRQPKQQPNIMEDVVYQQLHQRVHKLPPQHYPTFLKLKEKLDGEADDNAICRYMTANNFEFTQSLNALRKYIEWYEKFSKKYTLEDFNNLLKMDIFTYLGNDRDGRPVILNKAANVVVSELDDDQYCDFYLYWLEIFVATKFRGYVDQFVIIADVKNLSMANFKLSLTKRNISQVLMYCPERQMKLFAVNANTFAWYCWQILKRILPQKTLDKVVVCGNSQQQIVQTLAKDMDVSVIPMYLGGKNPLAGKPNEQPLS